ncbi:hypothetical protein [Qaidamihabitans albus]|uniref:hypothetical protein n=1 Tax=Qaidamihabitans albus TaxID=2795733 RepID=UPI0018F25F9F|nr:hypothetical protein [Qaidamihabitans albus]
MDVLDKLHEQLGDLVVRHEAKNEVTAQMVTAVHSLAVAAGSELGGDESTILAAINAALRHSASNCRANVHSELLTAYTQVSALVNADTMADESHRPERTSAEPTPIFEAISGSVKRKLAADGVEGTRQDSSLLA